MKNIACLDNALSLYVARKLIVGKMGMLVRGSAGTRMCIRSSGQMGVNMGEARMPTAALVILLS